MRVYGLDFTSSPKAGKSLTLAICELDGDCLYIEGLRELGDKGIHPLEDYGAWLRGEGRWKGEDAWVAGIELIFRFGLPLAAVCRFGWGRDSIETSWEGYVRQLYEWHGSFANFDAAIKEWVYPNEVSDAGNPIKVQFKRLTDQVAHSQSPMKVSDNPHPGAMFYRGCKALLEAGIRVPPLRNCGCLAKIAVEAYPRLVAQRFFPSQPAFAELVTRRKVVVEQRKRTPKEEASTEEGSQGRDRRAFGEGKIVPPLQGGRRQSHRRRKPNPHSGWARRSWQSIWDSSMFLRSCAPKRMRPGPERRSPRLRAVCRASCLGLRLAGQRLRDSCPR